MRKQKRLDFPSSINLFRHVVPPFQSGAPALLHFLTHLERSYPPPTHPPTPDKHTQAGIINFLFLQNRCSRSAVMVLLLHIMLILLDCSCCQVDVLLFSSGLLLRVILTLMGCFFSISFFSGHSGSFCDIFTGLSSHCFDFPLFPGQRLSNPDLMEKHL